MNKVLIVDDEIYNINSMKRLFRLYQPKMDFCYHSESKKAARDLETKFFDVLVTDMKMPDMDGLTLAQIAKSNNPAIKVVILTGNISPDLQNCNLIDKILCKPCSADKIINSIKAVTNDYS